jgi:hypothetical protein
MAKKKTISEFEALTKEGWSVLPSFLEEKETDTVEPVAKTPPPKMTAPEPVYQPPAAPAATNTQMPTQMPSHLAELAQAQQLQTPPVARLTPQQAIQLLMSGDQRMINLYGGAQQLLQTANQSTQAPQQQMQAPQQQMQAPPQMMSQDLDARIRAAAAKRALMMGQTGQ